MTETPKLHGWITPEYAKEMVIDLLAFIYGNSKEDFEYLRKYIKYYQMVKDANLRYGMP